MQNDHKKAQNTVTNQLESTMRNKARKTKEEKDNK